MEFDWNNPAFEFTEELTQRDIEESFEDPFAVRLLPDSPRFSVQSRYFNLGKSTRSHGVFSVYRTNGKLIRVIFARELCPKNNSFINANKSRCWRSNRRTQPTTS